MTQKILWATLTVSLFCNLWFASQIFQRPEDAGLKLHKTSSIERELSFLKEFLDLNFSFQSKDYLQKQAQLLPLLSPEQKRSKKDEISRLLPRFEHETIEQSLNAQKISFKKEHEWQILGQLLHIEGKKTETFSVLLTVNIEPVDVTYENIWGYQVKSFASESSQKFESSELAVQAGSALHLEFPCPIVATGELQLSSWRTKIVNTLTSEVEIQIPKNFLGAKLISFQCEKVEFPLTLRQAPHESTVFSSYQLEQGRPRTSSLTKLMKNERPAWIKKSLKSQLGLDLDEEESTK